MTTTSNTSKDPQGPRHVPGLTLALLVMITLGALVALALLWASQWSVAHVASDSTTSIDEARRAAWATPLFWVGVTLLAVSWFALWRWFRWRLVVVPIVLTLIAASLAGVFFWRSQTIDQPITITIWQCTPGGNPFSESSTEILKDCTQQTLDTRLAIGTFNDRAAYEPETTDGTTSTIPGLPVGTYTGYLTTSAPVQTASIVLAVERDGEITPLGVLDIDNPFGEESRTWSTPITIDPDAGSYLLLYNLSENDAVPDASITFDIQQCASTSPTSFDPAGCQSMTVDDWILQGVPNETGPPTFRQPILTSEGNAVTYSNLESRTYQFAPFIGNEAITAIDYGFLVIPSDGPQTADASVLSLTPGSAQETFSVEIGPDTAMHAYTIYVFPKQNVYAVNPGPVTAT